MSHIGKMELYHKNIFFYFEYSYIYISSRLNIIKLKIYDNICINVVNQFIYLKNSTLKILNSSSSLLNQYKMSLGLFRMVLFYILRGSSNVYKFKLQLIGLGYRFFIKKNFIFLKIGLSHIIKFKIPLFFSLKKRKNTLVLLGNSFNKLTQECYSIKNLKFPSVYYGKGIKFKNEVLSKKEGKKSQI